MRVTDGSAYPLVASKSGSDEQPQWHNLKADPRRRRADGWCPATFTEEFHAMALAWNAGGR